MAGHERRCQPGLYISANNMGKHVDDVFVFVVLTPALCNCETPGVGWSTNLWRTTVSEG